MVNNGGCEYICIVDIGKKKCCCGFGYILKLDGFNCLSSKGDLVVFFILIKVGFLWNLFIEVCIWYC